MSIGFAFDEVHKRSPVMGTVFGFDEFSDALLDGQGIGSRVGWRWEEFSRHRSSEGAEHDLRFHSEFEVCRSRDRNVHG